MDIDEGKCLEPENTVQNVGRVGANSLNTAINGPGYAMY